MCRHVFRSPNIHATLLSNKQVSDEYQAAKQVTIEADPHKKSPEQTHLKRELLHCRCLAWAPSLHRR